MTILSGAWRLDFQLPFSSFSCSCNNFGQCDISAEDFDFGPNPCHDTERYLEASYICVPSDSDGKFLVNLI